VAESSIEADWRADARSAGVVAVMASSARASGAGTLADIW
jgi:hypothetical protein